MFSLPLQWWTQLGWCLQKFPIPKCSCVFITLYLGTVSCPCPYLAPQQHYGCRTRSNKVKISEFSPLK